MKTLLVVCMILVAATGCMYESRSDASATSAGLQTSGSLNLKTSPGDRPAETYDVQEALFRAELDGVVLGSDDGTLWLTGVFDARGPLWATGEDAATGDLVVLDASCAAGGFGTRCEGELVNFGATGDVRVEAVVVEGFSFGRVMAVVKDSDGNLLERLTGYRDGTGDFVDVRLEERKGNHAGSAVDAFRGILTADGNQSLIGWAAGEAAALVGTCSASGTNCSGTATLYRDGAASTVDYGLRLQR